MVSVEETTRSASPRSSAGATGFRPDVDGLRAIAIGLVVAFHAGVAGFGGGFIGVDVFFVISGWLITRNLLYESQETGSVDLVRFWARRIRRLVPGLALMVTATIIGSGLVLSSREVDDILGQGVAATFYVSNILFASESQGYFAADVSESPFLHTWSLGVEEQFYLIWPVLVALVFFALRGRSGDRRRLLAAMFALLFVGSFMLSRSLAEAASPWAFYGLPSRVWQFAAAGLLATVGLPTILGRLGPRLVLGFGGLGLLIWAAVSYSGSTTYPGIAALLPVFGTLAVIGSGDASHDARPTPIGTFLGTRPLQWVGRLSYSWYLWHWPVLILAMTAFDRDDVEFRVLAVLGSLPVAWLAYRYVENPIRFAPALTKPTRTFAIGAAATAVATLAVLGVGHFVSAQPATPLDRQLDEAASLEGRWPTCVEKTTSEGDAYCEASDLMGDRLVLLVGDSKAFGWFESLRGELAGEGARLIGSLMPGCPAIEVDVPLKLPDHVNSCREARARTTRLVEELQPDMVVLAHGNLYLELTDLTVDGATPSETEQAEIWGRAFEAKLEEFRQEGREVVVILDNPAYDQDPNVCIARSGSVNACELSREESLAIVAPLHEQEREVVERLGIRHFDVTDELCGAQQCELGTDEYLHYFDSNHLSARSMLEMVPEISVLLEHGLAG